jgi:hypothetical protein
MKWNAQPEFWFLFRGLQHPLALNLKRLITTKLRTLRSTAPNPATPIAIYKLEKEFIDMSLQHSRWNVSSLISATHWSALDELPQFRQVLELLGLQVNPEIQSLQTADPTRSYKAFSHALNHRETLHVFTDASLKNSDNVRACSAVVIFDGLGSGLAGRGSGSTCIDEYTFTHTGPETIMEAELQAIESALLTGAVCDDLHIYSDSKSSLDCIDNSSSWSYAQWQTCSSRATIHRVLTLKHHRQLLNKKTSLYHVYSHLLEGSNGDAEKIRKMKVMEDRFCEDTDFVLMGNYLADLKASSDLRIIKPTTPNTLGLDRFFVFDKNRVILESVADFTEKVFRTKLLSQWQRKRFAQTEIFKGLKRKDNFEVDWETSLFPICHSKNDCAWDLIAFQHKLKVSGLPSKASIFGKISREEYVDKFLKEKVKNKWCDYCLSLPISQENSDNLDHIFTSCPWAKRVNNGLFLAVSALFASVGIPAPATWFSHATSTGLDRLNKIGDYGYVPKRVRDYIFRCLNKVQAEVVLKALAKLVAHYTMKKWSPKEVYR